MGRRKRGWKAASGLSLGSLRRLVEAKESLIEKLTRLRATLAAKLATVEEDLAVAGGSIVSTVGAVVAAVKRGPGRPKGKRGPGRPPGKRGPGRPKGSKNKPKAKAGAKRGRKGGPKGQSDLHNAIRAVLKSSAEPMKLVDVAAKVKANGYPTKSKNFAVILGLRLSEMKDVKRVERGVYMMK